MSKKKEVTQLTDDVSVHSGFTLIKRLSKDELSAEKVDFVSQKIVGNVVQRSAKFRDAKAAQLSYNIARRALFETTKGKPTHFKPGYIQFSAETPLGDVFDTPEDLVVLVNRKAIPAFEEILELINDNLESHIEQSERVIKSLMPVSVPSASETEQLRQNADLRTQFLTTIVSYTSEQLAELAGSSAQNKSQWASRYKREGRIFAITTDGQSYFPAFQFDKDYKPKQIVKPILSALSERGLTGWEIALWFITNSSFLGGRSPHELIDSEPALAVEAATREAPW